MAATDLKTSESGLNLIVSPTTTNSIPNNGQNFFLGNLNLQSENDASVEKVF